MSTRKKIPLIDASADLAVTGSVTITGTGSAVITFPSVTSTLATTDDLHAAATVADSTSINMSITGQQISADAIFGTTTGTICQGDDSRLATQTTVTGSAGSLKSPSTTGLARLTGMGTGTTRDYTVPDANATLLYSGGALGTPASGTVTNLTGTASININGTVGATTATTGKFTTVETTGNIELGNASDTTLSRVSAGVVAIGGVKIPAIAPGTSGNIMQSDGIDWVSQSGGAGTGIANANLNTTAGELGGAWTTWVPTFTNFTKGNATIVARYQQVGKTVRAKLSVTLGSTSSMTGLFTFSLPVTSVAVSAIGIVNSLSMMTDISSVVVVGALRFGSTTTGTIFCMGASGTYATSIVPTSSTVPFTWANTHIIETAFEYEAA